MCFGRCIAVTQLRMERNSPHRVLPFDGIQLRPFLHIGEAALGILWTIIIGFVAGVIAKLVMPGDNEPSGFVMTTILGIVGAFVASYLGQAMGWYTPYEGAGLIGAVVGAIIVLLVFGFVRRRA
jgi:uncharacterized membrane protein YeaQ/YmgE (transglycosylase-associated protein family)